MSKIQKQGKGEPTVIEDSILAGILLAMGLNVHPHKYTDRDRVYYSISGDVEKTLQRVYNNEPIGALTALNSVKTCRSMLFKHGDLSYAA